MFPSEPSLRDTAGRPRIPLEGSFFESVSDARRRTESEASIASVAATKPGQHTNPLLAGESHDVMSVLSLDKPATPATASSQEQGDLGWAMDNASTPCATICEKPLRAKLGSRTSVRCSLFLLLGGSPMSQACPACRGTGSCPGCSGTGMVGVMKLKHGECKGSGKCRNVGHWESLTPTLARQTTEAGAAQFGGVIFGARRAIAVHSCAPGFTLQWQLYGRCASAQLFSPSLSPRSTR